jgi:hypothetical protein
VYDMVNYRGIKYRRNVIVQGPFSQHLIFLLFSGGPNKLASAPRRPLQSNLMFAGKSGAYLC